MCAIFKAKKEILPMRKLLYDDIISFDTCEPNEVAQMISKLDYINKHTREGVHYHEPTQAKPKGWYQVSLPNRRQPLRRVDKKALIDEAYKILTDGAIDYRFGAVFVGANLIDGLVRKQVVCLCTREYLFLYRLEE